MKKIDELIKDIERDLVINLAIAVKYKRITFDESKIIAKDFLDLFPFNNFEDLFEKIYLLNDKHKIIRKVYVKYAPKFYEAKTEYILSLVRENLKVKNIDRAINIARRI